MTRQELAETVGIELGGTFSKILDNLFIRVSQTPISDLSKTWSGFYSTPAAFVMDGGVVTLSKRLIEKLGKSEEEIRALAEDNTVKELVKRPLFQMVKELAPSADIPEIDGEVSPVVLTNKKGIQGAGIITLLSRVLQKAYIILPSSVHEILCIPYGEGMDTASFTQMVREVNQAEVRPEERLADNAFLFKDGCLTVI